MIDLQGRMEPASSQNVVKVNGGTLKLEFKTVLIPKVPMEDPPIFDSSRFKIESCSINISISGTASDLLFKPDTSRPALVQRHTGCQTAALADAAPTPPPQDSDRRPDEPPRPKPDYKALPASSFEMLKALLRDYLFESVSRNGNYGLSEKELCVLKFLLQKKILFSHSLTLNKKIDELTNASLGQFLSTHAPRKRTQLYKRTIFINFWRYLESQKTNVIDSLLEGEQQYDYLKEIAQNRGNLINCFYENCFTYPKFRYKFVETSSRKDFWEFCNRKSLKNFERCIDRWICMIDTLLKKNFSLGEEKQVMMKIRLMSVERNQTRILKLFKIDVPKNGSKTL